MTSNTGREDYDHMVSIAHIDPGEPIFIVRPHDCAVAETIDAWVAKQESVGAPPAVLESALRRRDQMLAWPSKKPHADADHMTDADQKNLAYAFARRRWSRGGLDAMGQQQAFGRLIGLAEAAEAMIDAGMSARGAEFLMAKGVTVEQLAAAGMERGSICVMALHMGVMVHFEDEPTQTDLLRDMQQGRACLECGEAIEPGHDCPACDEKAAIIGEVFPELYSTGPAPMGGQNGGFG